MLHGYQGLELHYDRTNERGTRLREKVRYYVVGLNLYGVHYAHTARGYSEQDAFNFFNRFRIGE